MIKRRKWGEYYDHPEVVRIRELVKKTYSNKLKFIEESHQYFLDGVEYDCVSHVTHRFSPNDSRVMAENCVKKWQRQQDPSYKYYGMTVEEILQQWEKTSEKACTFGTNVHEFGESLFYWFIGEDDKIVPSAKEAFVTGKPVPRNKLEEAALKVYEDIPECMIPVLAETKVFNRPVVGHTDETPYAGTFDILFYYMKEPYSPQNGLCVWDWKTNGSTSEDESKAYSKMYDVFNNETLLFPFPDMPSNDLSIYTLQLNCYQIPLENVGLKVIARRLFWLHPNGEYDKIPLPNIANRVREALGIPSKEECFERYLSEFKELSVYQEAKKKLKKHGDVYKPTREKALSSNVLDYSSKINIGDCSWLFATLNPVDYKDFFEKYISYRGNGDKNPRHRGRTVKELLALAKGYKEGCNDPEITVEDCFNDLVMHIIIETIDGHKRETEAKKALEGRGYEVINCTGKLDSEFNVDLLTLDDGFIGEAYQVKPISTFLGNNRPDLVSDRINFFDKQRKYTEMYSDRASDTVIKYLLYDNKDDTWFINPNTNTSIFVLEELVDESNGHTKVDITNYKKNKELIF